MDASKDTRTFGLCVIWIGMVVWAGGGVGSQAVVAQEAPYPGIECECSETGAYGQPDKGQPPALVEDPQYENRATSPNGVYALSVRFIGGSTVTLTVTEVATNTEVLRTSFSNAALQWGFSPDDHRFVVWGVNSSGKHVVLLYDLERGANTPVSQDELTQAGEAAVRFSDHGHYLLYAVVTGPGQAFLSLTHRSGRVAYQANLTFETFGDVDDKVGGVGWGFSPDDQDRTLIYAVDTGPNSVSWHLINLAAGREVRRETISNATGASWRFSPCGDVVGLVMQSSASQMQVRLYQTLNGVLLYDATTALVPYELRSTDTHHVLHSGGSDTELVPNQAVQACPAVSLTLTPSEVVGGETAIGTIVLGTPAPSGGRTFTLNSSSSIAQVPASVTVASGSTSETFQVTTTAVATDETVTITATEGALSVSAELLVRAGTVNIQVVSLTLEENTVTGGTGVSGTVRLNQVAPAGGVFVNLTSDHEAAEVDETVEIEEGEVQASFAISTNPVRTTTQVTITAAYGGSSQQASLTIYPPVITRLELDPDSLVGGNTGYGTVTLNGPAPHNWGVRLATADTQIVQLDRDSLFFWEGATEGFFSFETRGVARDTTVEVVVTQFNLLGLVAEVVVQPAELEAFWLNTFDSHCVVGPKEYGENWRVIGGFPLFFSLVLNGEAPQAGAVIQIQSSDPTRVIPDTVVSLSGRAREAVVTVQTMATAETTQVDIIGSYRGREVSQTFTLIPAPHQYKVTELDKVTELGFLPGIAHNRPVALNNYGQVVGELVGPGGGPYLWSAQEGLMLLPVPPSGESVFPYDLNDRGWIVGYANLGNERRPVRWKNGTLEIGRQPGAWLAINNQGQIAGELDGEEGGAFRWTGDAPEQLTTALGSTEIELAARGLNERGEVLGTFLSFSIGVDLDWVPYGGIWRERDRPLAWFRIYTETLRFNNSGTVVAGSTGRPDGWRYDQAGNVVEFDYPELPVDYPSGYVAQNNVAAINDRNELVGAARLESEVPLLRFDWRAFWATSEAIYALECLVDPASGLRFTEAVDINELGQILVYWHSDPSLVLGKAAAEEDSVVAYLLTPNTVAPIDLEVTAMTGASSIVLGDSIVHQFQVTNQGTGGVSGVRLMPGLAPGLQPVSATSTQGACMLEAGQLAYCDLGDLDPGATATVTVEVRPAAPGQFLSRAMVVGQGLDTTQTNNHATIALEVQPPDEPRIATVNVAADETGTVDLSAAGLLVTFTRGSSTTGTLSVAQHFEPPADPQNLSVLTVRAPAGTITADTMLTELFWTVEAAGLTDIEYTLCLNISHLGDEIDPGTLVITRRAGNEAWTPYDSYVQLVGNVIYLCTEGLTAFSAFGLASSREAFSVPVAETAFPLEAPYQLDPVYPNPTVRWLHLSLRVRETQSVQIELFDVLGRRVAVLYRGELRAAQPYHFRFDGRQWARGLYMLRITGRHFQTVRQVIHL